MENELMEFEVVQVNKAELRRLESLKEFTITSVEIETEDEYKNLCELLKKVKGKEKEIIEFFKKPKSDANKTRKTISRLEKELLGKLGDFEKKAKKAVGDYMLKIEQQNTSQNPLETPKVQGVSASSTWKWEVEDIDKVPSQYLKIELNNDIINATIKSSKGTVEIPGIKIWEEKIVRVVG